MTRYMDRQVTSPTWGPPPPCKQALSQASPKVPGKTIEYRSFKNYSKDDFASYLKDVDWESVANEEDDCKILNIHSSTIGTKLAMKLKSLII